VDKIQRFRIELERAVAIKVLNAPSTHIEMLDERRTIDLRDDRPRTHDELLAEARVMAAISHPNVLRVSTG
jgi:hypothetical protein